MKMKGNKHIKTPMKHIKLFEQYYESHLMDEAVYSRISDVSPDKIRAMTGDEFFNLFQAAPDFEIASTYLNIFIDSNRDYVNDSSWVTRLGEIMQDRGWEEEDDDYSGEIDALKKDIQLQKDLADPKKIWGHFRGLHDLMRKEAEVEAKNPSWVNLYGKNNVDNFIKDLDKRVGDLLNKMNIPNHSDISDSIIKIFKPTAIMIANDVSLSDEEKSTKLWKLLKDIKNQMHIISHSVTILKDMGCWEEQKSYSDNLRTALKKDPSVWGRAYIPEGVKKEDTDLIRGIDLLARFGGI